MVPLLAACPGPYDDSYNPYAIGNDSSSSNSSNDSNGDDDIGTSNVPSMPGEHGGSSTSNANNDGEGVMGDGSWANIAPPPSNTNNNFGGSNPNNWNNSGDAGNPSTGQGGGSMFNGGPPMPGSAPPGNTCSAGSDPSDSLPQQIPQRNGTAWTMVTMRLGSITKYDLYTRLTGYYNDRINQTTLQTQVAQSQLGGLGLGGATMGSGMLNGGNGMMAPNMGMGYGNPGMTQGIGYGNTMGMNGGIPMMNGGMMPSAIQGGMLSGGQGMMMMQCQAENWQLRQKGSEVWQKNQELEAKIKELEERSGNSRDTQEEEEAKELGEKEKGVKEESIEDYKKKVEALEVQLKERDQKLKEKDKKIQALLAALSPSAREKAEKELEEGKSTNSDQEEDALSEEIQDDDQQDHLDEEENVGAQKDLETWTFNPLDAPVYLETSQEEEVQKLRAFMVEALESIREPTKYPFHLTPGQEWAYLKRSTQYLEKYCKDNKIHLKIGLELLKAGLGDPQKLEKYIQKYAKGKKITLQEATKEISNLLED